MMKVRLKIKYSSLNVETEEDLIAEITAKLPEGGDIQPFMDEIEKKSTFTATYSAVGFFDDRDGECRIAYREPNEFTDGNLTTKIVFRRGEKDCVTVLRDGDVSMVLVLDMKNPDSSSVYTLKGAGSFDLTVHVNKVRNTVKNGKGSVFLDYQLLQAGIIMGRIKFSCEVRSDG